ncbi:mechanosensitive ion channel family protein [Streptomyces sp. ST2-7A]|uniref:mechanosensitive ion channel family protein n=1 Tax=Streptomyces sp. ST2-7A TaxID=2907214 RepID=UPI001F30B599|nr:mechanosensitive ion channel family protein [Streptomyces sp. ST2-7A]MCE7079251.1 mechanosensitive ion channel family protein [Streptomyces sp. ST2-7A]
MRALHPHLTSSGPTLPAPSPRPPHLLAVLGETSPSTAEAATWVEENWEKWLAGGLRILLIVIVAVVVRAVLRRAITRAVERVGRADRPAARGGVRDPLAHPERRRQRAAAIGSVLRSVASLLVMGTAALMLLDQLGIQLGPLVAGAGIVGVALGFGARNLVTDVLTGMFILLEDQYGVGDRVDTGEATGTVLEIGLRVTTLRADDGEVWYVRNGEIKRVGNLSQGWATAAVETEVRGDADPERVHRILEEAGAELARREPWDEQLWETPEVLGLEAVSPDSMVLKVTAKVQPGRAAAAERAMRRHFKEALDAAGIERVDATALTLEKLRGPRHGAEPEPARPR